MTQDFMDPEIYADFIIEAREHLDTIEPTLLELERTPDNLELLDEIFRPMHSLKGASGFLGLNSMNRLAHKGESVLDELRKGKMRVTSEIMDLILKTTDALKEMIDSLEGQGHEGEADIGPLGLALDGLLAGEHKASRTSQSTSVCVDPSLDNFSLKHVAQLPSYALTVANEEHLDDFLEEAHEAIGFLNEALVRAEQQPDNAELINDLFRYFHNFKGNSGIIGHVELNALTHEAETLLNGVRRGECSLTRGMVDLLLSVVDGLEELVRRIDPDTGQATPLDISAMIEALQAAHAFQCPLACDEDPVVARPRSFSPAPQAPHLDLAAVDPDDLVIFEDTVAQQMDNMQRALSALSTDAGQREYIDGLYRSLSSLQNSASYMEQEDLRVYAERTAGLVRQARDTGLDFSLMLDMMKQEISILGEMIGTVLAELRQAPALKEETPISPVETAVLADDPRPESVSQTPVAEPVEKERQAREELVVAGKDKVKKTSSTIRVEHAKLDHLMNLIGELIINRNRFSMLAKALEAGENAHEIAQHLTETTNSMNRVSDDLQDTIMNVRMVPVQTVFSKFPRLVRDLSRKSGKKVELITEGEETELDKSVVEVIGDPLVHLLRNSLDHGLESAEGRVRAGKPETGRVWLRAMQKGNSVLIEVEDDGKGIDPEVMRQKAVEKGMIGADEARNMDDRAARELIFAPGFSTAAQITDISGRGVGMDVVRSNIRELKGNVQVVSALGQGTKFTLSLPLTLAIIDALLVEIAGNIYAIPLDAVSETTKIAVESVSEIKGRQATTLRGSVLGLADLGEILNLPPLSQKSGLLSVVIISLDDRRLGLVVEKLLQRQDVVIKSMGDYLGEIPGVSGATIMGDGRVILILDPHEIYRLATAKN